MAGHSMFRHADTEADLFVLPKITTNAQQRIVSRELEMIRITAADWLPSPLLLQIPLL